MACDHNGRLRPVTRLDAELQGLELAAGHTESGPGGGQGPVELHAAEPVEDLAVQADAAAAPGGGPGAGGHQASSRSNGPAADSGL